MVSIVCFTDGLAQSMGDQCSGRDDTLNHPMIDHRADDLAHLRNGHRPRQRQHNGTVRVFDHCPQHLVGLTQSAAPKGSLAHGGQQAIEGLNLFRVERLERFEAVFRPIVEFTCTHEKPTSHEMRMEKQRILYTQPTIEASTKWNPRNPSLHFGLRGYMICLSSEKLD